MEKRWEIHPITIKFLSLVSVDSMPLFLRYASFCILALIASCDGAPSNRRPVCEISYYSTINHASGILLEPEYGGSFFVTEKGGFCRIDMSSVARQKEHHRKFPVNCLFIARRALVNISLEKNKLKATGIHNVVPASIEDRELAKRKILPLSKSSPAFC